MSKPGHDIVSISDLLSGSKTYKIPRYQRGYSWDETNFEELWEDIKEKTLKDEDLFLGSMILSRNEALEGALFEIVDGQQRLITFTILLRVMYDQLEGETDQDRFRRDIYRLIASDQGTYKLTLGNEDEEFFEKFIKKRERASERRGLKRSHKMIRVAYELFEDKVKRESKSGKYDSKVDFLDKLFEAIRQRTQLLEITVGDEFDAYAIFESINAKRVGLTPAELIKNYVYSAVSKSEKDLNKVQQNWEETIDKLSPPSKEIEVTNYIRHYWIATTEDVREKELYRRIKNQYANAPSRIPNFVEELAAHSGDYAAIVYPEIITSTETGLKVEYLARINRFNFKQTYPLILATVINDVHQNQLDTLAEILETTILRRSIRGLNPNELEEVLSSCARLMHRRGISSFEEIKKKLRVLTPTDKSVKEDLVNSSYSASSKIILEEYEIYSGTGEKEIKNPTIEHIMPQTPGDYTDWGVSLEEHEHWLGNIGNLTLLGKPLNSSASNSIFDNKKKVYQTSEFLITKAISKENSWGPDEIKSRAGRIASVVIKRWPVF